MLQNDKPYFHLKDEKVKGHDWNNLACMQS